MICERRRRQGVQEGGMVGMGQREGQDPEVNPGSQSDLQLGTFAGGTSVCILSALRPGNTLSGWWHIQGGTLIVQRL